jgi:hypothetical protein
MIVSLLLLLSITSIHLATLPQYHKPLICTNNTHQLESNSVQSYYQALEKQCIPDKISRVKRKTYSQDFTSVTPLSTVYVPKKNHFFRKIVPFQQVQNQISSLEYALTELDPSTTSPTTSKLADNFLISLEPSLQELLAKIQ